LDVLQSLKHRFFAHLGEKSVSFLSESKQRNYGQRPLTSVALLNTLRLNLSSTAATTGVNRAGLLFRLN
jgi:hypothetical protein